MVEAKKQHDLKAGMRFMQRGYVYLLDSFLCETQPVSEDQLSDEQKRLMSEDGRVPVSLRYCLPEEATFVKGTGLGDAYPRVSEIEPLKPWPHWTEQQVIEQHELALSLGQEAQFAITILRHRE